MYYDFSRSLQRIWSGQTGHCQAHICSVLLGDIKKLVLRWFSIYYYISSGRTFCYSCFRNKISASLKFKPMTSNGNIYYHFTKERKMELDHILYQIYRTSFYLYVSCILLIKLPNIEELYMMKWLNGA